MTNYCGIDQAGRPFVVLAITKAEIEEAQETPRFHVNHVVHTLAGRDYWISCAPRATSPEDLTKVARRALAVLDRHFGVREGETIVLTEEQVAALLDFHVLVVNCSFYEGLVCYLLRGKDPLKIVERMKKTGYFTDDTHLIESNILTKAPPSLN